MCVLCARVVVSFFLFGVRGCRLLVRCVALFRLLYALVVYYVCLCVVCSFCCYVVLSVCLISVVFFVWCAWMYFVSLLCSFFLLLYALDVYDMCFCVVCSFCC